MTMKERLIVPVSLIAVIWALQYIAIDLGAGRFGFGASLILAFGAGTIGYYLRGYRD